MVAVRCFAGAVFKLESIEVNRRAEELFGEFFTRLPPQRRAIYKGRKDLATVPEPLRSFLVSLRDDLNAALSNEKQIVPEHVEHPPIYFDYIDSETPNALAFLYGDEYSFVGATIRLLEDMDDAGRKLSVTVGSRGSRPGGGGC
jgi:hypothetical protein